MEIRLAEKEEGLLEKDLIFEQDCRLCERVRTRVEAGKDDTLMLAKKVSYPLVVFLFDTQVMVLEYSIICCCFFSYHTHMYFTGKRTTSQDQRSYSKDDGDGFRVINASG